LTGMTDGHGYGSIYADGRLQKAHRVVWQVEHGPIPDGLHVLHQCDNPPCCNPAHLFLGTHADNMADKIAKGRDHNQRKTHCLRGHELSDDNTYTYPNGGRGCRKCRRMHHEAYQDDLREKRAEQRRLEGPRVSRQAVEIYALVSERIASGGHVSHAWLSAQLGGRDAATLHHHLSRLRELGWLTWTSGDLKTLVILREEESA
jgi:hypothetical protein